MRVPNGSIMKLWISTRVWGSCGLARVGIARIDNLALPELALFDVIAYADYSRGIGV